MKIAILGSGITGLTAAYRLLQNGHEVTLFEKEDSIGGLAIGFSQISWDWTLEKAYHHWFTNDNFILNLAKEIGHKVIIVRPSTDILINNQIRPFDSPISVLKFPHFSLVNRLRLGLGVLYLKLSSNYKQFEDKQALSWSRKVMGKEVTEKIWEPLFKGKFGDYKEDICLTWFWARIHKRTPSLAYPKGGFKSFIDRLGHKIEEMGGQILLNTSVDELRSLGKVCRVKAGKKTFTFEKVIVTLPSPVFVKVAKGLNKNYIKRISSIPHLHAQVLILVLKKPFLKKTYWLNITDQNFPFLVLADHTNFMESKHYGGNHILYIGNYLPLDHPFLKMSKQDLLKKFDPYLKKINPNYGSSLINSFLFLGPFAQPVVTVGYPKKIPSFKTPLKNIFIANLDMVYPWDRGTNYAVEMGEEVADIMFH